MKNENMFQFDDDDRDIVSSSKQLNQHLADADRKSFVTGGRHYAKKKHGPAGFFSAMGGRISDWWGDRQKWQRVTMITLLSLVLASAILFGVFRVVFDYNYNNITEDPEKLGFENVIDNKVINVALFGIDTRNPKSFKGLSDSIMILSVNTGTKKIKVISVMRDSLVPITYNGKTTYAKINSAYSKGGPELAIKTLNSIFKLDISEYATVNFYGMTDIIDAVDGIDVTLADGELNVYGYEDGKRVNFGINGMIAEQCGHMGIDPSPYFINKAGKRHLNGVQAVAYARIRHAANIDGTNNDYGRTDRQRYVMEQLFNKAVTMEKSKYMKLAKALIPCSETSLSYSEILSLAVNVLLHSPTFEQTRVPLTDYQMPSSTHVYYDLDYASKLIHAFIYDNITPEDYMAQNGVEKNDWYAKIGGSSGKKPPSGTTSSSKPSSSRDSSAAVSSAPPDKDDPVSSSKPTVSSEPDVSSAESGSDTDNSQTSSGSPVSSAESTGKPPVSSGESTGKPPVNSEPDGENRQPTGTSAELSLPH